ncbi:MAG: shikimate dehydrogenase [Gemmatimonadota bacterium]
METPRLPTGTTRLFALLGDPVAHSLSPRFQTAGFRAAGVDGVYLSLRCGPGQLTGLLRGIALAGGGGNVTVPYKERAVSLLDRATPVVERTGACNTFWLEGGRVHGDNTDVAGFREAVRSLVGPVAGARVLLLGAGGAARAALVALVDGRADAIDVLNRTRSRAETLRDRVDRQGRRVRVLDDGGRLGREGYDLIVNATALGLAADDPLPLDLRGVHRVGAALDIVVGENGATAWTRHAESLEIAAADGLEMLLHQGAAAFERWWGAEAPLDAMRAAVTGP